MYNYKVTLIKGLATYLQATGALAGGELAVLGTIDVAERLPLYGALLLPALWRMVENWRKNSGQRDWPRWRWPWKRFLP